MITVKSLGHPPRGAHWSYGPDYMVRIGRAAAANLLQELAAGRPLPHMGYGQNLIGNLELKNISGHYYLASFEYPISSWSEVYKVTVEEKAA